MAKDYDWTKANWWDYPEDDDVEVKEIEVDVSDLMLPKEYAYGGGVGTLFEPTPTYHQYHDLTAPVTYGTLMDQRRGFKLGGQTEEEVFGLQNIIGADMPAGNTLVADAMTTPTEGKMGLNLIDYDTLRQGGYNDSQIQEAIDGGYAPEIINLMKPTAKKSLDKAPWNQDNQTMTSGVVDSITNSNMILPQKKPRGSIYNDAAVFEDLVSGTDIPQNMYNQSKVDQFKDPIREMEAGITWSEEDKAAYPELYADFLSGYTTGHDLVPGMGKKAIDFKDAPVGPWTMRANDPTKGFLDRNINYRALNQGDEVATAKWLERQGMELPPNLQGIDTRNILEKTGDKLGDVFTGAKEGIESLGGNIKKGGKMVFGPLMALANARNPLNPKASNYNPALQGQVDFLKSEGIYGVMDQSGLSKITAGRLKGKNLVSGFGTNDLFGMYEKDLEKLEKTLDKLPSKWSNMKKNQPAKYKAKYDALVAKINQNKKEQEILKNNNLKKGTFPNKKGKSGDGNKGWQPTGDYGKKQGTTGSWTPGGSYSPKGYSARSHSGGQYGGGHHWADGGIINIIR